MTDSTFSSSTSPSVTLFQRQGVENPGRFALVLSSTPRRMPAMGGMLFDAQAGFFALGDQDGFDADAGMNESTSLLHLNPVVGFVPKAQEDAALGAFRRLFDRWAQGTDQDLGYCEKGGRLFLGLRFTPAGMVFVVETSEHWQLARPNAPGLAREWQYERLLDSGIVLANTNERTLFSISPAYDPESRGPRLVFERDPAFAKLNVLHNVAHLLAPTAADNTHHPAFPNLGTQATVKLPPSLDRAPDRSMPELLQFIKEQVEERELNDVMTQTTAAPSARPGVRL